MATRLHGALAHLDWRTCRQRFAGPAARQDVVLRESPADQLAQDWHSFGAVQTGDVIAAPTAHPWPRLRRLRAVSAPEGRGGAGVVLPGQRAGLG